MGRLWRDGIQRRNMYQTVIGSWRGELSWSMSLLHGNYFMLIQHIVSLTEAVKRGKKSLSGYSACKIFCFSNYLDESSCWFFYESFGELDGRDKIQMMRTNVQHCYPLKCLIRDLLFNVFFSQSADFSLFCIFCAVRGNKRTSLSLLNRSCRVKVSELDIKIQVIDAREVWRYCVAQRSECDSWLARATRNAFYLESPNTRVSFKL